MTNPSQTASQPGAGAPDGQASATGHAALEQPTVGGRHAFPTVDPQALAEAFKQPRLFMQLQVFTGARDVAAIQKAIFGSGVEAVLYQDWLDPAGVGILLMHEDPAFFADKAGVLLRSAPFAALTLRHELTMAGCTYSAGRDPSPADWLVNRPRRIVCNPKATWAVWYPLRRRPEFATLSKDEQGKLLFEHAMMAKPYGDIEAASDVRLSCYGIDTRDNEFVLGLIGPHLYPLSHLVQEMRKSQQTAKYIQSLGPFFVGRVLWQSPVQV